MKFHTYFKHTENISQYTPKHRRTIHPSYNHKEQILIKTMCQGGISIGIVFYKRSIGTNIWITAYMLLGVNRNVQQEMFHEPSHLCSWESLLITGCSRNVITVQQ